MILNHHRIHHLPHKNLCIFSNYTTCAIAQVGGQNFNAIDKRSQLSKTNTTEAKLGSFGLVVALGSQ